MKYQRGQTIAGVTIGSARDKWRPIVAEACTGFRLQMVGPRPRIQYEQALVRAAIAEVLSLRLQAVYAPIFGTLTKIERKIGVLADLRAEPWAPAAHPINKKTPRR